VLLSASVRGVMHILQEHKLSKSLIFFLIFFASALCSADEKQVASIRVHDQISCEMYSGPNHSVEGGLRCHEINDKNTVFIDYHSDESSPTGMIPLGGESAELLQTSWMGSSRACYKVFQIDSHNHLKILFEDCSRGQMDTISTENGGFVFVIPEIESTENGFIYSKARIYHWLNGKLLHSETTWKNRFSLVLQGAK
jgi:hypothetical protein